MRHRLDVTLTDRATIERNEQVGTGGSGGKEPIYELVPVEEDVRCQFTPRQTMHERVDVGERTSKPASVTFPASADIQEGDVVTIHSAGEQKYEVRGIDRARDAYRSRTISQTAELARRD